MSLFDRVKSLNLPVGDFAIFGSGPLIVRGIIPASNDLDIICRGQAWKRVTAIGELEYLSKYDVTVVTMCDGRLTFGTKWAIGEFDIDELIDGAEEIDGLPFVRLEHVTNYKKISKRPKDLRHIEALKAYQLTH
jgi:predicted nucleotidyltransferase